MDLMGIWVFVSLDALGILAWFHWESWCGSIGNPGIDPSGFIGDSDAPFPWIHREFQEFSRNSMLSAGAAHGGAPGLREDAVGTETFPGKPGEALQHPGNRAGPAPAQGQHRAGVPGSGNAGIREMVGMLGMVGLWDPWEWWNCGIHGIMGLGK